jgi:hypothetical protein
LELEVVDKPIEWYDKKIALFEKYIMWKKTNKFKDKVV